MKIIGHRGAAGLELENTLPSFELAFSMGVYAVELDIQLTLDNEPVVCHDANLSRVGGGGHVIKDITYQELSGIKLGNNTTTPHLREVMDIAGDTTVIIEVKVDEGVREVLRVLTDYPDSNVIIASPIYKEIAELKMLRPDIRGYIRVLLNPFEALQNARAYKADGLDMNFWILNPLTYFIARAQNLEIMVYTVNSRLIARFLHFLYPQVAICTDHPEWFMKQPWKAKLKAQRDAMMEHIPKRRKNS